MANPHANPNPSQKAKDLSKKRQFADPFGGPDIDEEQLLVEIPEQQRVVMDLRTAPGNKFQKKMATHYMASPLNGAITEKYFEWLDVV